MGSAGSTDMDKLYAFPGDEKSIHLGRARRKPQLLQAVAHGVQHAGLLNLGALNVLGFGTFIAVYDFEVDGFALLQGLKPGALNGGVVNKDILAGVLRNKTEALLIVEPFYF